jgi:Tfp pilus assembly protein PilO
MPPPKGKEKAGTLVEAFRKLWTKDKKFIIQQAIILGFLAFLILFIFIPLFVKIHDMRNDVKDLELNIRTAESKIKRMPVLTQQKQELETKNGAIRERFFQIRDLDQLLGKLSNLAAENNVRITSSRPIDELIKFAAPFDKRYLVASYEFTLEGGYHNFGKLINEIERLPYWTVIRELTIQPLAGGKTDALQCKFRLTVFVEHPQKG